MPQQYKSAKRAMKKPAMSHGNKPKMYGKPKMYDKKPNAKFPDLSGDGKVTKKDILMGRGVIDRPKMLKNKRKDIAGKTMMAYARPAMYNDKRPKGYVSDAQRKAVHASKADGGAGHPDKRPKSTKITFVPNKNRTKTVDGPKGTGDHYTMTKTTKRKVKIKEVSKKRADRISKSNERKLKK